MPGSCFSTNNGIVELSLSAKPFGGKQPAEVGAPAVKVKIDRPAETPAFPPATATPEDEWRMLSSLVHRMALRWWGQCAVALEVKFYGNMINAVLPLRTQEPDPAEMAADEARLAEIMSRRRGR